RLSDEEMAQLIAALNAMDTGHGANSGPGGGGDNSGPGGTTTRAGTAADAPPVSESRLPNGRRRVLGAEQVVGPDDGKAPDDYRSLHPALELLLEPCELGNRLPGVFDAVVQLEQDHERRAVDDARRRVVHALGTHAIERCEQLAHRGFRRLDGLVLHLLPY